MRMSYLVASSNPVAVKELPKGVMIVNVELFVGAVSGERGTGVTWRTYSSILLLSWMQEVGVHWTVMEVVVELWNTNPSSWGGAESKNRHMKSSKDIALKYQPNPSNLFLWCPP